MKRDQIEAEFASKLKSLRLRNHLSIAKMADKFYIDERTWAKYERAESAPTAPELIKIYSEFGEDLLRDTLECVYSGTYKDIEKKDVYSMRKAAVHFWEHIATDKMVRDMNYLAFGKHGSNFQPQLCEFVVLDHLPMDYRVAIAKLIINFYYMAEVRGELICPDDAEPDFDTLISGIEKGLEAVSRRQNSYTTFFK